MGGLLRRAMAGAGVLVLAAAVGVANAAGAAAGTRLAAGPGGSGGAWGKAIEVPGSVDATYMASVSCASVGNCSAGGVYEDSSHGAQAFVVSQVGGTWGKAIEVPGIAALSQGGYSGIASVSCAAAGNCSAGGYYTGIHGRQQAFVVSQVGGTWHTAIEVPGTAALNQHGLAVNSVSCAAAGNCSAGGGGYVTGSGRLQQAFVVSQIGGTWGNAIKVPGTAALNQSVAAVNSVSCAAAGNCSAGGFYSDSSGNQLPFVLSQVHGAWQTAIEVPGTAALQSVAAVNSVSCASPGNCSAGGGGYLVSQVDGTWHKAIEVPASISSVSCASPGNCSAGGISGGGYAFQAFVVSQTDGTWDKGIEVPGTAALNQGGNARVTSVSCASPGNCSAGGDYSDQEPHHDAFVVSQVHGIWHTAIEVPGTAALNRHGQAEIASVSCAAAGNCGAGGYYAGSSGYQAFVVSET